MVPSDSVDFDKLSVKGRKKRSKISIQFQHQWFGDLVSPAWWSFLWMNEGFATLYENHLTDFVFPGERWLDTFLIRTVHPVLEIDADPNIRPMTFYVENPEEIEYLFDNVAYLKCELFLGFVG